MPILKQEGLLKDRSVYQSLDGYGARNQEDMKEGLLAYIDEDKRSDYNNGLFKKKCDQEIKRRLSEYGPFGLIGHIYYKQSLTVSRRDPGLALPRCRVCLIILSAPLTKN